MTPTEAVDKAASILGSQAALAAHLNIEPPTVNQWITGRRPVPPARAVEIEKATNGKVKRHELCPGFPWEPPVKNKAKPNQTAT
jgi:DNA-binding transcriptional regulator YdaS (Cro superfamily)